MPAEPQSREGMVERIREEREQLAHAVEALRAELRGAADVRSRLPMLAVASLAAGFAVAGGIGATVRLALHRTRIREAAERGAGAPAP